jgi:hypothetical protein
VITAERASILDDGPPPAPIRPAADQIRALADPAGFTSREGRTAAPPPTVPKRTPRIHRTGRTATLSLKTTPDAFERFYALADRKKWLVGETFEKALAALERELAAGRAGDE